MSRSQTAAKAARSGPRRARLATALVAAFFALSAQAAAPPDAPGGGAAAPVPASPALPAGLCPKTGFAPQPCSDAEAKDIVPLHPIVATLDNGNLNQTYPLTPLVEGGTPGYTGHVDGALPLGMHVSATGALFGTPQQSGVFPFKLIIRDAAKPPTELRLTYELRVDVPSPNRPPLGPPRPRPTPAVPAKPAWPPPPAPAPAPLPSPPPPLLPTGAIPAHSCIFVLGKVQLAALASGAPAPAPPAPDCLAAPSSDPMADATEIDTASCLSFPPGVADIAALTDVEYPTRPLFNQALRCRYGPEWSQAVHDRAQALAVQEIDWTDAPDLKWTSTPGCGCVPDPDTQAEQVYAVFPFWRAKLSGPIDFSRFNRISLQGVQLGSNGTWTMPRPRDGQKDWWGQTNGFAQLAQSHGSRLDLMLEIDDWSNVSGIPASQIKSVADTAARRALALTDTPLVGPGAFARSLLAPWWRAPGYVFDGVTVVFPYASQDKDVREPAAAAQFRDEFMLELIRGMQRDGRPYTLNIVAPDWLTTGSPDSSASDEQLQFWNRFMIYKKLAEPARRHPELSGPQATQYLGRTDIAVRLMTPMPESTKLTQKSLRLNIEKVPSITGTDRVAVLQSIIPILFNPAGQDTTAPQKPVSLSQTAAQQLDDDIVYFKQNFGGVGFWPMPMRSAGAGDYIYARLQHNFQRHVLRPICSVSLRLVWQAMMLMLLFGIILYVWLGQSSLISNIYLAIILGLAMLTLILGGFLLVDDPALTALRKGNVILGVVIAAAFLVVVWFALKPKVPRP